MKTPEHLFFHPDELASLGEHAIIGATVRIRKPDRCRIGRYSIIDDFTYVSCALTIGDFTHIGANSSIIGGNGHVRIGSFVNTAPGCRFVSASHDFSGGGLTGPAIPPRYAAPAVTDRVELADHVLFGAGTVVLPGVSVPEGVATGAMTLLTPGVKLEPWTLYVGQPARPLRKRESATIIEAAKRLLQEKTS